MRATRAEAGPALSPEPAGSTWKRPVFFVVGVIVLAAVGYTVLQIAVNAAAHESTDDAFIEAHIVSIAPKVSGQIAAVHVVDNQEIKQGDLLVEIDPRDYQMKVEQKRASMATANANINTVKAGLDLVQTRVATAEASAKQVQAEAEASEANAQRAAADLLRYEQLSKQAVVSPQEYDHAKETAAAAEANLRAAREKAASEASKVAEARAQLEAARTLVNMAEAQIHQSQVDVQSAELDLSYAKIVAPASGRIARKLAEPGAYVQVGQNLLAIVPTNVWTVANFKETQLIHMRIGQPVDIEISAVGDQHLRGHVESIQAGSGARFSLLPPENAVGNFVKVVQRVPVKIVFDEPLDPSRGIGPGMSVFPTVKVQEVSVTAKTLAIAAIGFALVVVSLVQFLIIRKNRPA